MEELRKKLRDTVGDIVAVDVHGNTLIARIYPIYCRDDKKAFAAGCTCVRLIHEADTAAAITTHDGVLTALLPSFATHTDG